MNEPSKDDTFIRKLLIRILKGEIITRNDCAVEYAKIIRMPDWHDVVALNRAICVNWSQSGLCYIKEKAWKIADSEAA